MTVVTPAAVANSAAINLVIIPPVPSDEPAVATETKGNEPAESGVSFALSLMSSIEAY